MEPNAHKPCTWATFVHNLAGLTTLFCQSRQPVLFIRSSSCCWAERSHGSSSGVIISPSRVLASTVRLQQHLTFTPRALLGKPREKFGNLHERGPRDFLVTFRP